MTRSTRDVHWRSRGLMPPQDRPVAASDDERPALGGELVGDDVLADDEKDVIATLEEADPLEGRSAEEGAIHAVDDQPL